MSKRKKKDQHALDTGENWGSEHVREQQCIEQQNVAIRRWI